MLNLSRNSRLLSAATAALSVASLMGCDMLNPPDEASETPVVEADPAAEAPGAPAGEQPPAAEAAAEEAADEPADAPRTMAYTHPEDGALGTLPDGVGLEVGSSMPTIALPNSAGVETDLNALAESGALLVVFYRGGWCPYCNFQIRELTSSYSEFQERGVTPVVISVDRQDSASVTTAAYEIPFPVLSDPDLVAHRAFEVAVELEEEEVTRLSELGIDLEASSGRDHRTIAVPSIFLVDREGKVVWAHAEVDHRERPSTEQLLTAIDASIR